MIVKLLGGRSESPSSSEARKKEMTLPSAAKSDLRFAVGGNAGRVMEDFFLEDASGAKLSPKFRLYYRLRPLIPIWLRQRMQKTHGDGMCDISKDWFIPVEFLEKFEAAIRKDLKRNPDARMIHPWPDGSEMCVSLTHDVETIDGVKLVDGLAKLEESHGFRSCWYFIPHKYPIDPGLIKDLKQRGHEVGVHGYNHDGRLFSSSSVFEKRRGPIEKAFKNLDAVGFRAPMVHRNLDWIETLGPKYDASCFDIDPYQAMPGGVGSFWPFMKGDMVELPYSLPQDHTLFVTMGKDDIEIWKRKLSFLSRWRGMAMLVSHPDYLNTEARLGHYESFLEHLKTLETSWFALPDEITDWWIEREQSQIVSTESGELEIDGLARGRGRILTLSDLLQRKTT